MASTWNVDARDTVARPSRIGAGATARLRRRVRTTRNDGDPTAAGNDGDSTAMGNDGDPTAAGNDGDSTAMGNDGDPTATRPPDDGAGKTRRGRG